MKETVVTYLGLVSYLVLVALPVVLFDLNSYTAITVLLGVPTIWLTTQLQASKQFIACTAAIAMFFALTWQMIGHTTGAWYELSHLSWRLFGVVPLESVWYTFVTFCFYIFAYEFFTDDKHIDLVQGSQQKIYLFIGLVSAFLFSFAIALYDLFIPYAFLLIVLILLASLIVLPLLLRGTQFVVLEKVLIGTVLLLPFICITELVAIMNIYWVFAFESQYIATITLLGETVPVEKVLSLLMVPVWVLLLHEWFFDDTA